MLYKEVEMALGINSFYSKQKLMQHDNIKVRQSAGVFNPRRAGGGGRTTTCGFSQLSKNRRPHVV